MEIYSRLYIGESIKNADKIIRRIKKGSRFLQSYVITLATNQSDQLEIYAAYLLKQKYYVDKSLIVIGIATDYKESLDLVLKITEESLQKRGDCNLKEYLKEMI